MKIFPILRPKNAKQRQWTRIVTLVSAILIEACCGTLYAFSVLSDNLSERLGYTATELAVIVGVGDNGLYISQTLVGFMNDRWGPSVTSLFSAICVFLGYGCMAMTYEGYFSNSNFILFAFYFCLAGVGSSGMHMASMSTNVKNFSSAHRGKVVGVLMSLFGLSALIFSSFNTLLFVDGGESDTFGFLVFMTFTLTATALFGSVFLTPVGMEPDDQGPKAIVPSVKGGDMEDATETSAEDREDAALLKHEHKPSSIQGPQTQVAIDIHGLALFKSRDFWMLFYIAMVIAGAGLMYINYVGKVISALSTNPEEINKQQNLHVSLISAFSCIGRFSFGFLSDFLLFRFGIRRRILISFCTVLMLTGMVMVSFIADLNTLVACTVMIGFAYGSIFSVTPTVMSERFGVAHYGVNWGWLCWGVALGGQVMSLIFGAVYDAHADENGKCAGQDCYVRAFYLNCITVGSSVLVGLVFSLRRK